jgi:hypothetical protein
MVRSEVARRAVRPPPWREWKRRLQPPPLRKPGPKALAFRPFASGSARRPGAWLRPCLSSPGEAPEGRRWPAPGLKLEQRSETELSFPWKGSAGLSVAAPKAMSEALKLRGASPKLLSAPSKLAWNLRLFSMRSRTWISLPGPVFVPGPKATNLSGVSAAMRKPRRPSGEKMATTPSMPPAVWRQGEKPCQGKGFAEKERSRSQTASGSQGSPLTSCGLRPPGFSAEPS